MKSIKFLTITLLFLALMFVVVASPVTTLTGLDLLECAFQGLRIDLSSCNIHLPQVGQSGHDVEKEVDREISGVSVFCKAVIDTMFVVINASVNEPGSHWGRRWQVDEGEF